MNEKKKWNRRLAPHIYDYNYKVGESYYTPQTDYIGNRDLLRSHQTPPEAKSFAERYKDRPIYGSTRGLPYDESKAELPKPLVSRRARSTSRGRSRDRDADLDVPSTTSRLGRSRDRRISFNDDDFGIKFSVDDAFNYQEPARRYRKPSEILASEEDFDIKPNVKKELEDEFKRIKKEFRKADSVERGTVPRTSNYEETLYNSDVGLPGKRRVKREEVSYSRPSEGSSGFRKSSYTESKFESNKPPIGRPPKPLRLTSVDDDLDFKKPFRSSRLRKFSTSDIDDDDFSLKYITPRPNSRNRTAKEEELFQQNLSLRERRRNQESEQLSENISNLIGKMNSHNLGDGYKYTRTIRSSSLDPYEREPRVKARVQSRAHHFSYGVGK